MSRKMVGPLTAFKKEMHVIIHKGPGVYGAFSGDDVFAEPLNEEGLILVIFEDV
jgi:hypothetical protein